MSCLRQYFFKIIVVVLILVYFNNKIFNEFILSLELPIAGLWLSEIVILLFLFLLVLIFIMKFFLKYDLKKIKKIMSLYILLFFDIYFIFSLFVVAYFKLTSSLTLYISIFILIILCFMFLKDKLKVLRVVLVISLVFNILIGYDFIHKYNKEVNIVKDYFYEILEKQKPPSSFFNLYTKNLMEAIDYKEHFYSVKIWLTEENISKRNIERSYLYLVDEYEDKDKKYIRMYFDFGKDRSIVVELETTNDKNRVERVIIPEYNCFPPDYNGDGKITYEDVTKAKEHADFR
ncbi:hypothetical protein [Orenia marismortui]|uniref:EF-hand domain-containing protein n=1 Tax=Orenia marismortui TaxID=46469 RepID=A0A4V3GW86_9FIRM|nr:hypothetical protein [Orenia marismortui]TDX43019.1 hypothetical protein C7959_1701 [Orenia marismortui]